MYHKGVLKISGFKLNKLARAPLMMNNETA